MIDSNIKMEVVNDMKKRDILFKLQKEVKKAEKRQYPNATKDSGHIRGLKNAISIIENYR